VPFFVLRFTNTLQGNLFISAFTFNSFLETGVREQIQLFGNAKVFCVSLKSSSYPELVCMPEISTALSLALFLLFTSV
jgi:hypothetical protein